MQTPFEDEVRAVYYAVLGAWNDHDAAAMARWFAPEGHVIGFDGSQMRGPAEIETILGQIFAHHRTPPYVAIVREVRVLDDVALLRAVVGMIPSGATDLNPALNAVQTLIMSRRDGAWRVEGMQSTPAAFHGRPEASAALTEELRGVVRGGHDR